MASLHSCLVPRVYINLEKRISIARAIINEPEILFIDEPAAGINSEKPTRFYDMLGNLNQRKNTAIVLLTSKAALVNKNVKQIAFLNKSLLYHGPKTKFFESVAFRKMIDNPSYLFIQ
jgi:ABC-type Mn2+/Zn2+ transport system ATPase subunit